MSRKSLGKSRIRRLKRYRMEVLRENFIRYLLRIGAPFFMSRKEEERLWHEWRQGVPF